MASPAGIAEINYQKTHSGDSHVPSLIAALTCSLVIAYIAVTLRMISRRMIRRQLKADDWLMLFSLIFTNVFIISTYGLLTLGYGRHQILVMKPVTLNKLAVSNEIIYAWGILFSKVSALYLLRDVFPGKDFRNVLYGVGAFVLAYSITQTLAIIFTCDPIQGLFNTSIKGRCIDIQDVFLVCSAFNIVTDAMILALPLPKLWRLQVTTAQKIQLTIIFTFGGSVIIIGIIRTTYLKRIDLLDIAYTAYGAALMSSLEMVFANLSACLPAYGPLLYYLSGHRTSPNKADNKAPPGSGSTNNRHKLLIRGTSSLHPFTRLEENFINGKGHWTSEVPLTRTMAPAKSSLHGNVGHDLGPHGIEVRLDLEQTSQRSI